MLRKRLALHATLTAVVVAVLAGLAWIYPATRSMTRWLIGSRHYKTEVLAQAASAKGELKHIEWDGWGMAGQDTTVYLVFDPTDSLSAARNHQSGTFSGIPCGVYRVRRLENHWYTVQLYTNESWDQCN